MNIRLGVCCLILGDNKSQFKTLQLKRTQQESNPLDKIFGVYKHNLSELVKVLKYLASVNIWHYRVSSDMFPLADHVDFESYWNTFCSKDYFWLEARQAVQEYLAQGGRLSTHPDQFCVISSSNPDTNDKGIRNLEYHAKMFDMLGIPQSYYFPINIHVSNGKLEHVAAQNTIDNLPRLSASVLSRLVFETEDKSYWTYQRLFQYFPNIPITLDYHHRLINNLGETEQQAHDFCVTTWSGIRPLFHYSEGKDHRLDRTHSDFISSLPSCAQNIDIEVEAKQKNLAIFKFLDTVALQNQ